MARAMEVVAGDINNFQKQIVIPTMVQCLQEQKPKSSCYQCGNNCLESHFQQDSCDKVGHIS